MKQRVLAAALFGAFAAAGAQAGVLTPVNVYSGDGATAIIDGNTPVVEFDWNSGSTAVAIGKGPEGSDPTQQPNPFTFLYQSNLVNFNDNLGNPLDRLAGLNADFTNANAYEFTMVANILETAAIIGANTASFTPNSGTISIFYDCPTCGGVKSNTTTGAGFADGIEILRMTVTGGTSTFTYAGTGLGTGGTNYDFDIVAVVDFANSLYISGVLGAVTDLEFQSSQNLPLVQPIPTAFFAGGAAPYAPYIPDQTCTTAPGSCDLFIKVDGSNTFTANIPEPGTLLLLGFGLAGLGFVRRGRFQA